MIFVNMYVRCKATYLHRYISTTGMEKARLHADFFLASVDLFRSESPFNKAYLILIYEREGKQKENRSGP